MIITPAGRRGSPLRRESPVARTCASSGAAASHKAHGVHLERVCADMRLNDRADRIRLACHRVTEAQWRPAGGLRASPEKRLRESGNEQRDDGGFLSSATHDRDAAVAAIAPGHFRLGAGIAGAPVTEALRLRQQPCR